MSVTEKALVFATAAHAAVGQKRKYDGAPYIVHPIRVADTVKKFGGSDDQIAAAFLHDVVEDTQVTIQDIRDVFGFDIAIIVDGLTDVSVPEDGNRATRKAIDRQHTHHASAEAQFVKCADIIDNSSDIELADPSFWKVYRQEMLLTLEAMTKVRGAPIWEAALQSVTRDIVSA